MRLVCICRVPTLLVSDAQRRAGVTVYQTFFIEIVRQCRNTGLLAGDQLFADSTALEANASQASVGSRALLEQLACADAVGKVRSGARRREHRPMFRPLLPRPSASPPYFPNSICAVRKLDRAGCRRYAASR